MAALDVGVYDNFVSDTLQSEMSDLRILDESEVELVNGQFAAAAAPLLLTAAEYLIIGCCAAVTIIVAKYGSYDYGYNSARNYPPGAGPTKPPSPVDWENDNSRYLLGLPRQRCY